MDCLVGSPDIGPTLVIIKHKINHTFGMKNLELFFWKKNSISMKQAIFNSFLGGLTLILCMGSCAPAESYNIVIQGGQIFDGMGNPSMEGSIGIKEGKMYVLTPNQKFHSEHIIVAEGLIIAPGFIDVHSHTPEGMINPERNANECFIRQGVTKLQ